MELSHPSLGGQHWSQIIYRAFEAPPKVASIGKNVHNAWCQDASDLDPGAMIDRFTFLGLTY